MCHRISGPSSTRVNAPAPAPAPLHPEPADLVERPRHASCDCKSGLPLQSDCVQDPELRADVDPDLEYELEFDELDFEKSAAQLMGSAPVLSLRSARPNTVADPVPRFGKIKCIFKGKWKAGEKYLLLQGLTKARCWAVGARWMVNNMHEQSGSDTAERIAKRREVWQKFVPGPGWRPLKEWFGPQPSSRTMTLVWRRTRHIADLLQKDPLKFIRVARGSGTCSFNCNSVGRGSQAFVRPVRNPRTIFFCPNYFDNTPEQVAKNLVHECAHLDGMYNHEWVGGERAFTRPQCRELAIKHEIRARDNPDNYAWFFNDFEYRDPVCTDPSTRVRPIWRVKVKTAP